MTLPVAQISQNAADKSNDDRGVCYIDPARIFPNPLRTRSERSLEISIDELTASIAEDGFIEPIVVRSSAANNYEVIAGERRLRAAHRLGIDKVPCIVRRCDPNEALALGIVENVHRVDLDPMGRARGIKRLLAQFGYTQRLVAARLGMSQSAVAHFLRLLTLPAEVQTLIEDGTLSMGHGKLLARIKDAERALDVANACVVEQTSVRQLEGLLAREMASAPQKKTNRQRPPYTAAAARETGFIRHEQQLPNGLLIIVKQRADGSGSGKIEIPFDSPSEIDCVVNALQR